MTDPIADMLSRIRNATIARHQRVDVPASKLKTEIAKILHGEGYIQGYKILDAKPGVNGGAQKTIRLFLKYGPRGERVITGILRVSRPGRRVYFRRDSVPKVLAGLGTNILTTSRGVMTGREALQVGVGGEVLCNVW
ncbi:MAG: 30S ribosomal protein S8 [Vicinamibacterales bacterium]|jgi:small subunit ribosomal protein S8|nr:30S ribosomal protein S8 [Acidobacteriota bacterium]MDP7480580.1 30S ribosomal protein S8 [Vicinamibacterales bacterium]MDP7672199.1 30S ribosomal protein S8 [Vicinamibacterales bacterium]HJO37441.1 30S ribosomal protein S8 [Vicinamibacterales bacterium]|tara:strand:+ start:2350 stop:2760 length:411 start_codon:yes stop_codon:yes gene_type:complete